MIQIYLLLFIFQFEPTTQYYIISMNADYQLYTKVLQINQNDYTTASYFSYGIWSRYTPLGQNNQVGAIGIFDSSCFHIHNVIGQSSRLLNFLFFDCLEYPKKKIKRKIFFKASNDKWKNFQANIDNFSYEFVWHYFEITSWPYEQKLQFILTQGRKTILNELIDESIPYSDLDLLFTVGGGLYIDEYQNIPEIKEGSKFSFFPGKIYIYPFSQGRNKGMNEYLKILDYINSFKCICTYNMINRLPDQDLEFLQSQIFTSQYPNCNNFALNAWIKITNIKADSQEFTYQLIKLSPVFSTSKLINQNLVAFQLFYVLSPKGNKICITTYSFTFPLVNIDFSDNPFLIQKEIDISNDIKLWHYISVGVIDDEFQFYITFFEDFKEYNNHFSQFVNHFHMVRYQLEYGNVEKQFTNYLNIQFSRMNFYNCPKDVNPFGFCHFSCKKCDGPTSSNCLSCSKYSNRIYLPDQKSCVCPYDTIDNYYCEGHKDLDLFLNNDDEPLNKCQFGYFELENECMLCPSIIQENFITCLDCLQNPGTWQSKLFCEINLSSYGRETSKQIQEDTQYFISDGNDLNFCKRCNTQESSLYEDYQDYIQEFQSLCLTTNTDQNYLPIKLNELCYICDLKLCLVCKMSVLGFECVRCRQISTPIIKINGRCEFKNKNLKLEYCSQPYYMDSLRNCKLCDIEYCKYCFEYSSNDLSKSTLYYNFNQFDKDEFHKIGCAQCENGFSFDFNKGKCLYNQPSIQNCIRSYISQKNIEVCTLSQMEDFTISPEISNCKKFIQNCKQCIQNPQKEIKCVLCEDGYTASIQTGQCYECSIENAKNCIEGQSNLFDGWMQLVQSFIMQFLNNYFYPPTQQINKIFELPNECQTGFQVFSGYACQQYCDQNCISCIEQDEQFHCNKCQLNYFGLNIKSSENGKCLQCPQLCLVCQSRTIEEIKEINPYFEITDSNKFYTYKCFQTINDKNIILDPYTNIAKYCYSDQCTDNLVYKFEVDCLNIQAKFSPTFYEYYENNIDFNYCNQLGLKKIVIKINQVNSFFGCPGVGKLFIDNQLKNKIFSLQQTHLQIKGGEEFIVRELELNNFDSVKINNMIIFIYSPTYWYISNGEKSVDLVIMHTLFQSFDYKAESYSMNLNKYNKLILKNVTFQRIYLYNQSLLDCSQFDSKSEILIEKLKINHSSFESSNLINVVNFHNKITIEYLELINCFIINSEIFKFNSNFNVQVDIIRMNIQNNQIFNTTFIKGIGSLQINFIKTEFSENEVINSIIFYVNLRSQFSQIQINKNDFLNSKIILIDEIQEEKSVMKIEDFKVKFNQFYQSIVFELDVRQNEAEIYFYNLDLVENKKTDQEIFKYRLFYLNSKRFYLQNCKIKDQFFFSHFSLFQVSDITIENVTYFNKKQKNIMGLKFDCTTFFGNNQLFFIQGFQNLEMKFIRIENISSFDNSFIQILSDILFFQNINSTIYIQDIIFQGNLIQKITQGERMSLLLIYSQNNQGITCKNLYFKENFFNQVSDDYNSNSAGLIYINSQQSTINLQNISCYQNGLTNSTNPFIFINTEKLNIFDVVIKNHNILSNDIWKQYYKIDFKNQLNENEVIIILKQIFGMNNRGGGFQIITTNLHITQGYFENILSESSQVFDIITQGDGIIKLESLNIQSIQSTLNSESQGCINIYSKNSQLNFYLTNTTFQRVNNKLDSAILTITPSLVSNLIKIQNVQLEDCISLINQFIYIDFSLRKSNLNKIIIQNLKITQNDQAWIKYFEMIQQIGQIEIDKIISDNAVINLQGCDLNIDGLIIEGTYISPIIKISDSPKIIISNSNFYSIKTFYPINILHFQQQTESKQQISLKNMYFNKYSIFSKWKYDDFIIKTFSFSNNQCSFDTLFESTQINQQIFNIQTQLDILNQNIKSSGCLIYFESISMNNIIQLNSISVSESNCRECQLGLLYFFVAQFKKLKLIDLIFTKNYISQYGCLHFNTLQQINQKAQLHDSLFILNYGNLGAAIYSKQLSIDIVNCYFSQNTAMTFGGAIYMQNCKNDFKILKSLLIENVASQGGGIFFNGSNQLTKENFEKSLIQLNTALLYTNNVIEIPHHLSLSINNQEMISEQIKFENLTSNVLKLKKYKIIEQGKIKFMNTFMIPSNQIIQNYKLFNPQNYTYLNFISELSINQKNSLNEKLFSFSNSSCDISLFTQLSNNETLIEQNSNQTIFYNQLKNGFDLGQISIIFNPYQEENIFYQLQINCAVNLQQNILQYIVKGKTLKCQLGEFFYNEGCQKCENEKGFYSVSYNNSKCSIFDKTKFKNITSNQIELLEGFWRPNHFSDLTEECFKNQQFCKGGWSVGNDLCQLGHTGALCEECDINNIRGEGNYFKMTSDSTCAVCNDNKLSIILTVIFALLWSILQIILTLRSINESNKLFQSLKLRQRFSKILFKLNQDYKGILIKMLINYLWILTLIFTFNIQFPLFFAFVDRTSNPSIFVVTSLECYTADMFNIELIYLRIIMLFIVQLSLFLAISGGYMISSLMKNEKFNNSILSNTAIYLYIANYAEFAKQYIQIVFNRFASLLSIRKISNIEFIQGNVSLEYNTNTHQIWIMSFVIPGYIITCFIMPFLFFILLFILRNKLDQIKLRKHICYVFNEYKENNYYWEFIKIWQKTIMIFIILYFETNVYLKGSLLGLSLLVYQAFAMKLKPYLIPKFNNLDILTSQICSIVIFVAIAKYASEQLNNQNWSVILQFLIMILMIKLCIPFVENILQAYNKNYKIHILTRIHRILKFCLPSYFLTKKIQGKLFTYQIQQQQIHQNFLKLKQYLFSRKQNQRKKPLSVLFQKRESQSFID
ncbi:unnamed protein product [Paramecium sonneborni]|uniref:Transmembrane protein n=1 Tax=Paramecium sonneborni TaxID=65129 RepID=A0A8S1KVB8_9CILI|nr:unnamed protein product [Paramecium sonneborni]